MGGCSSIGRAANSKEGRMMWVRFLPAPIIRRIMKEYCICAAVKTKDGIVVRGHRHGDCYATILKMQKEVSREQGFVTSLNRFVTREEGARLQNEADIKSVYTKRRINRALFSEDLY